MLVKMKSKREIKEKLVRFKGQKNRARRDGLESSFVYYSKAIKLLEWIIEE